MVGGFDIALVVRWDQGMSHYESRPGIVGELTAQLASGSFQPLDFASADYSDEASASEDEMGAIENDTVSIEYNASPISADVLDDSTPSVSTTPETPGLVFPFEDPPDTCEPWTLSSSAEGIQSRAPIRQGGSPYHVPEGPKKTAPVMRWFDD